MNGLKRQPNEALDVWEARLQRGYPARALAATMQLPEHEYRRRLAELCSPAPERLPELRHARDLSDAEFRAELAKIGVFH